MLVVREAYIRGGLIFEILRYLNIFTNPNQYFLSKCNACRAIFCITSTPKTTFSILSSGIPNFATVNLLLQDQGGLSPKFVTTFYPPSLISYPRFGADIALFGPLPEAISEKFV